MVLKKRALNPAGPLLILRPSPTTEPSGFCPSCPIGDKDLGQACLPLVDRLLESMAQWEEGQTEALPDAVEAARDLLRQLRSMVVPPLLSLERM